MAGNVYVCKYHYRFKLFLDHSLKCPKFSIFVYAVSISDVGLLMKLGAIYLYVNITRGSVSIQHLGLVLKNCFAYSVYILLHCAISFICKIYGSRSITLNQTKRYSDALPEFTCTLIYQQDNLLGSQPVNDTTSSLKLDP